MREFVASRNDILANIEQLRRYATSRDGTEREYYVNLLRRARCYVVWEQDGRIDFAPSRFVGYKGNTISAHEADFMKHGQQTNDALIRLLGSEPQPNKHLDDELDRHLASFGTEPYRWRKVVRRYWEL